MADSRRINANIREEDEKRPAEEQPPFGVYAVILSSEFWPPFKEEKLEVPEDIREALEAYCRKYEKLKVPPACLRGGCSAARGREAFPCVCPRSPPRAPPSPPPRRLHVCQASLRGACPHPRPCVAWASPQLPVLPYCVRFWNLALQGDPGSHGRAARTPGLRLSPTSVAPSGPLGAC